MCGEGRGEKEGVIEKGKESRGEKVGKGDRVWKKLLGQFRLSCREGLCQASYIA